MTDAEDTNYREETNFEIIGSKMLPKFALYYSSFEFAFSLEIKPLAVFVVKKKQLGKNPCSLFFSLTKESKFNEKLPKHPLKKNNKKNHSV